MSQHAPKTCNEGDGLWLPLIDYSVKSGVSLSTIRRKIKTNSIPYKLEKGRYLILFSDVNSSPATFSRQATPESERGYPEEIVNRRPQISPEPRIPRAQEEKNNLPALETSVRMISDAFEHALKEKDERIRLLEMRNRDLEDQLNELRLLVRVIEEKYEVRY